MNFKEKNSSITNEKTIRDLDNVSKTELHDAPPARKRAKMSENGGELRSSNQLFDEITSGTNCLLNSANYAHKSNDLAPSYLFIVSKVNICSQTNTVELGLSKVNINRTVDNQSNTNQIDVTCYLQDSW